MGEELVRVTGRRRGNDEVLAAARAAGQSVKHAGQAAGLSERTARRRLQEPDVAARVDELRRDRQAETLAGLDRLSIKAIEALDELVESGNATVRLGAARLVLTLGLQLHEQVEMGARVRRLEELAAETRDADTEPAAGWPA